MLDAVDTEVDESTLNSMYDGWHDWQWWPRACDKEEDKQNSREIPLASSKMLWQTDGLPINTKCAVYKAVVAV